MWYFSWILGTGLAIAFAVLNAIWFEIVEMQSQQGEKPPVSSAAGAPPARKDN
jgi:cytochrome bd-I ubiquinol oxidase subunit X